MSSRGVVLGTTVHNDAIAFQRHVRLAPNFIDIDAGKEDAYALFLDHPEWLCTLKGTPERCALKPGATVHQFVLTGVDASLTDDKAALKNVLDTCDTMFRREQFNVFGIGHSAESLQACFDLCDDMTLDISVVQEQYWPNARRRVEEIVLPIARDRRVRLEAIVDAGWTRDRALGLTWLSRHSMLQILPYVRSRDAIVMNSWDMDRDLSCCLSGRPLAPSELQRLEKNNDCLSTQHDQENSGYSQ
jgi:hypothetical protein